MSLFPPPESDRRQAIVLVHGAWVGEWSWLPILPQLRASGRPVHAVSLTGHGARSHQSGPQVTLADHVADVVGLIETLDLVDITLVGHSYGGRVVTQVWPRVSDRIARMVYLDAHTPVAPEAPQSPDRVAAAEANGGMLPFTDYVPSIDLVGSVEARDWFMARVMPQSFRCLNAPWQVDLPDALPKLFVSATGDRPNRFSRYAEVCRDHPAWDYLELDGTHFLMMTNPDEVADAILGNSTKSVTGCG